MPLGVFVFECSTSTYLECIEKGVFGSNVPWPLQVAKGDYCLLRHYEVGTVFALWQAESDGGRKLVPRAWGGRFPFQARVTLASAEIIEVPAKVVQDYVVSPATGVTTMSSRASAPKGCCGCYGGWHREMGLVGPVWTPWTRVVAVDGVGIMAWRGAGKRV